MSIPSISARTRIAARRTFVPLVLLLLLAFTSSGCVTTGVNPISGETRAYGYSWEEEKELGQDADEQIQAQYGVYENEALQEYVDAVAQDVLAESHMRRPDTPERFRETEFHFRVLDSPIVNAFALPGGYVYVTRGLLAHLNNEAQLAVVLGHEIGHVAARHASQQAARRQFTQGLLLGGAVLGQVAFGGQAADRILGLGGTAAQLLSLRYSRDNERESDRLGVEYAVRAGYQAAEGAAFFRSLERMQEQSDQGIPTWQSTHPDPGAREETIPRLAETWQEKVGGTARRTEQTAYYGALEDIVFGENPRHGYIDDGTFYHPELRFRFSVPSQWAVQNQPQQVVLVEPEKQAYVLFRLSREERPRDAARAFGEQDGITVIERVDTDVNGHAAHRVIAEAETQRGQRLRILTYFIAFDGTVYQFQGLTSAERYTSYRASLEETMTSFDELTDPDRLNVQPRRLVIERAAERSAFQRMVDEQMLPDGVTTADLAIVNQVGLEEMIERGQPVKLPR